MQPVTTSRAPSLRASAAASTVSIDSCRAASMNAQVLTTMRSASAGDAAATKPSATSEPATLSESTWFFGQPSVSIQKRCPDGMAGQSTGAGGPSIGQLQAGGGPIGGDQPARARQRDVRRLHVVTAPAD